MQKNIYGGKFIVFEGLDGSGQSTQANLLSRYLMTQGKAVFFTKEPTKWTEAGKKINDALDGKTETGDPLKFQKMYVEDRAEHLEKEIVPALKEGKTVISDRYFFSTLAFGGLAVPIGKLVALNDDFLYPDKIIFLDVSAQECLRRIKKRGEGIKFFEKRDKLEKVLENYRKICRMFPDVLVVNGERNLQEIHREIVGSLNF
ncbi:MAG: dTMP kinase [bacterium]